MVSGWPATDGAVVERLLRLDVGAYVRSRNEVDGAVSRLSPYITHGFTSVPEVIADIRRRTELADTHKFVFELAWREYFHHLWGRCSTAIFEAFHPPPGSGYQTRIPEDLLGACTGVKVIDETVKTLYAAGYIHNHARMWLASYMVHFRKVDWLSAADWMYGYLLDGDLPSNHLSWQWVAGTLTRRPYLFNAENVARYAPSLASWGTAIDCDYDRCREIATSHEDVGPERVRSIPVTPPALMPTPTELSATSSRLARGKIALIHPWALCRQRDSPVVLVVADFHERWPWSGMRWRFLQERIAQLGAAALVVRATEAEHGITDISGPVMAADHPIYDEVLAKIAGSIVPVPRYFPDPQILCRSFSFFWHHFCAKGLA